jgi:hypothetical protein
MSHKLFSIFVVLGISASFLCNPLFVKAATKTIQHSDVQTTTCDKTIVYTNESQIQFCIFPLIPITDTYELESGTGIMMQTAGGNWSSSGTCELLSQTELGCWHFVNFSGNTSVLGQATIALYIASQGLMTKSTPYTITNTTRPEEVLTLTNLGTGFCDRETYLGGYSSQCRFQVLTRNLIYPANRFKTIGSYWGSDIFSNDLRYGNSYKLILNDGVGHAWQSDTCYYYNDVFSIGKNLGCSFNTNVIDTTGTYNNPIILDNNSTQTAVSSLTTPLIVNPNPFAPTPQNTDTDADGLYDATEQADGGDTNGNSLPDYTENSYAHLNQSESISLVNGGRCETLFGTRLETNTFNIDPVLYDKYYKTMAFQIGLGCGRTASIVELDFEVDDQAHDFSLAYYNQTITELPAAVSNFSLVTKKQNVPIFAVKKNQFDDLKLVENATYKKMIKNGKNIVRVNYSIEDNSPKDSDPSVGSIVDPVVLLQNVLPAKPLSTSQTNTIPNQPTLTNLTTSLIRTGGK